MGYLVGEKNKMALEKLNMGSNSNKGDKAGYSLHLWRRYHGKY